MTHLAEECEWWEGGGGRLPGGEELRPFYATVT